MIGTPWKSVFALVVAGLSLCSVAKAQELKLNECPPAVQSTIQSNGQGGTLTELKLVDRDGGTFYVAEIGLPENRDMKLYIAPDGTLVRSRKEIDFRETPAKVRSTVLSLMPAGSTVTDVDVDTTEGVTIYVVEFKVSEQLERKITMNAEGAVMSEHDKTRRSK
ncbi:hypothetical protein [Roseimicrobium sp. ORNL1]|uniref:hypothetical protein n=1 Tax=Roseimicrobium sp. ORNL1 TaxID=2711231 RepID=UPI0013E0FEB7|nr:hypothetical protein [Roseimicrobium sp. ORNL1]QIF03083.1 hypothetical protein G5S37_16655 [Roseimicrobium sp. ORNL1]